jgi:hypothetical protein
MRGSPYTDIQIQRATEPLDKRDGLGVGSPAEKSGLLDQVRGNDTLDDAFPLIAWL